MTSILPLSAAQDRFAVHNTGFGWSEKELVEVIRCLNVRNYHFQLPGGQAKPRPGGDCAARLNAY